MQEKPLEILKKYWQYDSFRPLQEDIINSVIAKEDTLALMPTGGGKSITFQIPALMKDGLCLVITPLVALMKDQVNGLLEKGIKAEMIHTGMSFAEIKQIMNRCLYAGVKLLYISPERLESSLFEEYLPLLPLSMIAIDEAHCISQWGYDFRPSYLNISNIRDTFPDIPILAVTATATKEVVDDIQEKLCFRQNKVYKKSFIRQNLHYFVISTEDKLKYLNRIFNRTSGSGIVYVRSRKKTKIIADYLKDNGFGATFFHAGLDNTVKHNRQKEWTQGKIRIIVATNAFGMGIDKPDVRVVVHIDLPDSLEAYYQEAGRAGRDENDAYAIILFHKSDESLLKKRIKQKYPKRETILNTYNALCNFLQIAEGEGAEQSYPLDISKFTAKFKLSLIQTYSSLAILRSARVINFIEEIDTPSRIMFRMRRDDLYKVQMANDTINEFTKLILRMYSGLFSEYTRINEYKIAKKSTLAVEKVKELLIELSRKHIIYYIPQQKSPYISFPDGRIPEQSIYLDKSIYTDRETLYNDKINSVINYVSEKYKCRSQILLAYFDDFSAKDCGNCDICLQKKKKALSFTELEEARKQLQDILSEAPQSIEYLENIFNNNDTLHAALFWMFDNKIIHKTNYNLIALCSN